MHARADGRSVADRAGDSLGIRNGDALAPENGGGRSLFNANPTGAAREKGEGTRSVLPREATKERPLGKMRNKRANRWLNSKRAQCLADFLACSIAEVDLQSLRGHR